MKEELWFAIRTGSRIDSWDLPISLAHFSDEKLTAEVLRRGDRVDLSGVLASVPDDRLYRELSGRGTLLLNLSEIAEGELLRELDLRGRLPRVDLSTAGDAELYRELGRRRQALRKARRGGRPAKPRCACGRYTQDAGRRRTHSCGGPLAYGDHHGNDK